jgi:apolipoprotein N-acyltransferase
LLTSAARIAARAWLSRAAVSAAAWVVLEWAFPKVFPWSVGDTLGSDPRLRQGAALGGVHGLALLVMLVNELLAEGTRLRIPAPQRLQAVAIAVALQACAVAFGACWAPEWSARGGPRVAVVQANLATDAPDPWTGIEHAFTTYARFTEPAAAAAELVVWPETVLRVYVRDNPVFRARLAALADAARRPLLLGALDRISAGDGELNSAYLFAPGAAAHLPAIYHKAALLPFGEYVPGAAWWPALRRWRVTGEFVAGAAAARPLDVDLRGTRVRLAPSICFEATRPGAFNQPVRDGATLLVNLTDDAWLASEKAAAQHLALTRMRAVETGRWLVRASNSGISAFIDPGGGIVAALPFGAAGTLVAQVETRTSITPYARCGEWVVALCGVFLLLRTGYGLCSAGAKLPLWGGRGIG